jgi:hypothetical protein
MNPCLIILFVMKKGRTDTLCVELLIPDLVNIRGDDSYLFRGNVL